MGLLAKSSKSLFPKAYEYFSEEQYPFNDLFFVFFHLERSSPMRISLLAITILSFQIPALPAFSHSGGLNAQGCHAGSQPYHCHRTQSAPTRSVTPRSQTNGDRNCSDFRTWNEAQAFFENAGRGDPHRLDADNDGIACETLR